MEKKQVWHYSEFPEDKEAAALMPGFEIQYMITKDHVEDDTMAVFGHCMFPPRSSALRPHARGGRRSGLRDQGEGREREHR